MRGVLLLFLIFVAPKIKKIYKMSKYIQSSILDQLTLLVFIGRCAGLCSDCHFARICASLHIVYV